jgi:hypothetical protein
MVQHPQVTLDQLCAIFPAFEASWAEEKAPAEDGLVEGVYYEWSHHAVLRHFLEYFAMNHGSFTAKQLRAFGAWVNRASLNLHHFSLGSGLGFQTFAA